MLQYKSSQYDPSTPQHSFKLQTPQHQCYSLNLNATLQTLFQPIATYRPHQCHLQTPQPTPQQLQTPQHQCHSLKLQKTPQHLFQPIDPMQHLPTNILQTQCHSTDPSITPQSTDPSTTYRPLSTTTPQHHPNLLATATLNHPLPLLQQKCHNPELQTSMPLSQPSKTVRHNPCDMPPY